MKAKEFIIEGVAGPKNCWPGYRKTGTQPGTGKNKGKRVNDCEKIKEDEVEEGNSGAKYKIRSIGHDAKGDYYISPSTGKKVYKKSVKVGDHENPKTGEHKGVAEGGILNFISQEKPKVKKATSLSSMRKEFEKEKSNEQPSYMQSKDLPKNPKHVKTVREELENEFDMIERIIEQIADQHAVDADLVWEDLSTLTDDELYVFAVTSEIVNEDWQKANKRDKTDGMSQKAVNAYRRENPGSKLKTAVTTKPGKLKKGGKASKRRKSYCSRSRGQMKMHSISCAKTPDKAICKARRRWNC